MDRGLNFVDAGIASGGLHLEAVPWNGEQEQVFLDQSLSVGNFSHFDSDLSSMISAAAPAGTEALLMPEMIGKQGGVTFPGGQFHSDRKILPPHDEISVPSLGISASIAPPSPFPSPDPGLAAKFPCFMNNVELPKRFPIPLVGNAKLSRVCSTPSINQAGSLPEKKNSTQIFQTSKFPGSGASFNDDDCSVSQRTQSAESGPKISAKRRAGARGKCEEDGTASFKAEDDAVSKRLKPEEEANRYSQKQSAKQRPPEPPKDYIHVRARRGQATDSHSLAERVRREKISERMKLLQNLVPGCNKVTGKALMLDEIINYVQSLQRQVEFLSMKLASVNPGLDYTTENRVPKEMYHLISSFHHHQSHHQFHQTSDSMDPPPLDSRLGSLIPPLSSLPSFNEDDLQSIIAGLPST